MHHHRVGRAGTAWAIRVAACGLLLLAAPVRAQDRPAAMLEATAGWVGFADDGIVSETLVGVAGRVHLTPRLSVGPELSYIDGPNHSHLVLTGNLTADLVRPARGAGSVTPFVVVGAGLFRTREQFFNDAFTSSEGAFTAGGGVRAGVSDRVTVGVDVRVGWETHIRISGLVGVRLGPIASP